jgi:hypothetical protein
MNDIFPFHENLFNYPQKDNIQELNEKIITFDSKLTDQQINPISSVNLVSQSDKLIECSQDPSHCQANRTNKTLIKLQLKFQFQQFVQENIKRIKQENLNLNRRQLLEECFREFKMIISGSKQSYLINPSVSVEQIEQIVPFSYQILIRPQIISEMKLHNIHQITNEVFRRWNSLSKDDQ